VAKGSFLGYDALALGIGILIFRWECCTYCTSHWSLTGRLIYRQPITSFTVPVYWHFYPVTLDLHVLILECEDITLPLNMGIWLSNDAVSYFRRMESLSYGEFNIWDIGQTEPCTQIVPHMRTPDASLSCFSRNNFRSLLHQLSFLSRHKYC
jgi:hypothetical protein